MFIEMCQKITGLLAQIHFDALVWIVWGSYLAIFIVALIATAFSSVARSAQKKPFLALTNAYSGVNLAVFLLKCSIGDALMITALFWVVGYLLYGVLCFFPVKIKKKVVEVQSALPVQSVYTQPARPIKNNPPAANSNIKLDHAVTVTDNLLNKNLSKSDRQELEKLKNTLAVLQIKGTLTPAEADILNENFNALLKLMAKYNA
ncbi:MAG: hypothetical protein J1G07_04155 [Clostridiales bacterium]|nr:hypothetical protein [Clostridiales bacterium]